jgi:hypothetical protein
MGTYENARAGSAGADFTRADYAAEADSRRRNGEGNNCAHSAIKARCSHYRLEPTEATSHAEEIDIAATHERVAVCHETTVPDLVT